MKKTLSILFILTLCFSMCSCSWLCERYVEGLDTYDKGNSAFSICNGPMPLDMIDRFEYIDGNHYFYSYNGYIDYCYDKMLIYLTYDEKTYLEAKEYVFSDAELNDDKTVGTIGSYVLYTKWGWNNESYPYWYSLIAFSDETNTFVVISMYDSRLRNANPEDYPLNEHIKEHFGEWYEFK